MMSLPSQFSSFLKPKDVGTFHPYDNVRVSCVAFAAVTAESVT